jgi:hypothetical protein
MGLTEKDEPLVLAPNAKGKGKASKPSINTMCAPGLEVLLIDNSVVQMPILHIPFPTTGSVSTF